MNPRQSKNFMSIMKHYKLNRKIIKLSNITCFNDENAIILFCNKDKREKIKCNIYRGA